MNILLVYFLEVQNGNSDKYDDEISEKSSCCRLSGFYPTQIAQFINTFSVLVSALISTIRSKFIYQLVRSSLTLMNILFSKCKVSP